MSVPELKLMVCSWQKQSGDKPVPQTRQALITRFDDSNHHGGDQQLPFHRHCTPPFVAIPTPAMTATADPAFCDEVRDSASKQLDAKLMIYVML